MNELGIQTQIVESAIKDWGGHAFKMRNEFVKGISDLAITLPFCPTAFIEIKYGHDKDLSPHQREFLRKHVAVGGLGGWVRVWPARRRGEYWLQVDRFDHRTKPTRSPDVWTEGEGTFLKRVGVRWPIGGIIEILRRS